MPATTIAKPKFDLANLPDPREVFDFTISYRTPKEDNIAINDKAEVEITVTKNKKDSKSPWDIKDNKATVVLDLSTEHAKSMDFEKDGVYPLKFTGNTAKATFRVKAGDGISDSTPAAKLGKHPFTATVKADYYLTAVIPDCKPCTKTLDFDLVKD